VPRPDSAPPDSRDKNDDADVEYAIPPEGKLGCYGDNLVTVILRHSDVSVTREAMGRFEAGIRQSAKSGKS
jgi:hypothetical protein